MERVARDAGKKLSERAWHALADALSTFEWYKRPFETMIRARFAEAPELLATLNFSDTKRQVVDDLIAGLRRTESRYQALVLDVLVSLRDADSSFPNLARLRDGHERVAAAQDALHRVEQVTEACSELRAQQERLNKEREANRCAAEATRTHTLKLEELHSEFLEMHSSADPQGRGIQFEQFLNRLFALWDLEPRAAYRLDFEQVDGAFTFRTDDYLLEARWWKSPLGPKELNDFKAKVDSKARNTLGLCIAVNGFTEGAVEAHSRSQTPLILMDGTDLMPVLQGRIGLDEVLERKRRHAAETGVPIFRVSI